MAEIKISEVSFYPLRPSEKGLIGIASCLFDGKISLNSISVYLTPSGDIRLLFPDKVLPNSKRINIYYPINQETYEIIRKSIVLKIKVLTENVRKEAVENKVHESQ